MEFSGFAIALSWPETYCKQAGAWYDTLMQRLGFNHQGYYKAGHAAVVLVQSRTGKCHYFDFGRYHAPFANGRVRSADTDPELKVLTTALIHEDKITNIEDILSEHAKRKACHGSGDLHASICRINFETSWEKALSLQNKSPLPYGPFVLNGTNCSRFVQTILLAGKPNLAMRIKLKFLYTLTPAPITNVKALRHSKVIPVYADKNFYCAIRFNDVLPEPPRPEYLPRTAQWLAGEGAGSWFYFKKELDKFMISRYADDGSLEFKTTYQLLNKEAFNLKKDFKTTYLSHHQQIRVIQAGKMFEFTPLSN
ncbi:hypothetical protein BH23BAC2_BH23BAC2_00370 [soil metagenome]